MWMSTRTMSSSVVGQSQDSPLHSIAQYIVDYIDLVENVPNDIARQITRLHEHNHRYHQLLQQLEAHLDVAGGKTAAPTLKRRSAMLKIQRYLIQIQEIADDKLLLIQSILDKFDSKARQLDHDYRAVTMSNSTTAHNSRSSWLDEKNAANSSNPSSNQTQKSESVASTSNIPYANSNSNNETAIAKDSGSNKNLSNGNASSNTELHNSQGAKRSSKRLQTLNNRSNEQNDAIITRRSLKRNMKSSGREHKKNKSNRHLNNSPDLDDVDPDEPTYCICEQVSFGEMIGCDNPDCPIEWFHFSCVALTTKPKGKWYCPNCRGERSNVPKN